MRWIYTHLLWDPTRGSGLLRALWAMRKLLVALAGTALLTWREWEEHHPYDIVIVTLIHFAFMLALVALFVFLAQWISRSHSKLTGR
ncbi:MAG TPA: hypothetical protein VMH85_21675 [Terriglobales bacterium]|nr:hypothetical protein [Terriglobales bacterium]